MLGWVKALFTPVAGIFAKREERKAAREAADSKLKLAKQDDNQEVRLNKDEWEHLQVKGMDKSWKDEYAVVSVISIVNLILVGGILAAFGHEEVLEGVGIAINALSQAGVDVGFLLEAAVLSALGFSIWKRF